MKKIMFTLLTVFGLVSLEAAARHGYRNCGRYRGDYCGKMMDCGPAEVQYQRACPQQACKVDFVSEQQCPPVPCCVRYVKVEEPALVTKHISYSVECPSGCTAEQKANGMMNAGEVINYSDMGS